MEIIVLLRKIYCVINYSEMETILFFYFQYIYVLWFYTVFIHFTVQCGWVNPEHGGCL